MGAPERTKEPQVKPEIAALFDKAKPLAADFKKKESRIISLDDPDLPQAIAQHLKSEQATLPENVQPFLRISQDSATGTTFSLGFKGEKFYPRGSLWIVIFQHRNGGGVSFICQLPKQEEKPESDQEEMTSLRFIEEEEGIEITQALIDFMKKQLEKDYSPE